MQILKATIQGSLDLGGDYILLNIKLFVQILFLLDSQTVLDKKKKKGFLITALVKDGVEQYLENILRKSNFLNCQYRFTERFHCISPLLPSLSPKSPRATPGQLIWNPPLAPKLAKRATGLSLCCFSHVTAYL